MNIQTAAVKIISQWEHGGRYDCHGNGAYGLIGFQGGWLTTLLHRYVTAGGALMYPANTYSDELMKEGNHDSEELDDIARQSLMQQVQREVALDYMTQAITWQLRYYPFKTALAQLICCDIGVNSGISNYYVAHSNAHLFDDEASAIHKVMVYRHKALEDYGFWQKYEGIRRRWGFYMGLIHDGAHPDLTLKGIQPEVQVNGNAVNLGDEPIQPMSRD